MTKDEMIAQLQAKRDATSKDAMIAHLQAKRDAPAIAKAAAEQPAISLDQRPFSERMQALPGQILDSVKKVPEREWEAIKLLAQGAGRAMDFPGGVARTAANALGGVVNLDDVKKALVGNAPTNDEYWARMGMPEGNISTPLGDVSTRKIGGFAADIAMDPLTLLAKALGPGAHVVGDAVEGLGKTTYKSALKKVDQEVAKYGKEPVSDLLMEHRITGSADDIQHEMNHLADSLHEERNKILTDATDKGARVDVNSALNRAKEQVAKMRAQNNPELGSAIDSLENRIKTYERSAADPMTGSQGPTPLQSSSWKTTAANNVDDAAWEKLKSTPVGQAFDKNLSSGLREATEQSVGKTLGPEAGEQLATKNDQLGRLLTSQEKAEIEANKEMNKNAITSVDAPLAAISPTAFIMKKGADIAKMTGPRTAVGLKMMDLGKTRIPDALARRVYVNRSKDIQSPWLSMYEENNQ